MSRTRLKSFWSKYQERWNTAGSLVCVGLDSQLSLLPSCVAGEENPIWSFNQKIIDATKDFACAYKPNLAFYLSDGLRGYEALKRTVDYIPEEIPVILDCKVGDIGNTMTAYLEAFFTDLRVDAITLNPLMGKDVLTPLFAEEQRFAFALALTSNPSASDFLQQDLLCEKISGWIEANPKEQLGAVIGATQTEDLSTMRALLPDRIFLIPGVGAQGGDLEAVVRHASASREEPLILVNSSRGIIFKDKTPCFDNTAALEAENLMNEINKYLKI